jgi:hypothetical protein
LLAPFGKICRVRRILRVCEYIAEWCICVPKNRWGKVSPPYRYRTHAVLIKLNSLRHMTSVTHTLLYLDNDYQHVQIFNQYFNFFIEKIPNSPNPNGRIRSTRHSRTRWMPTLLSTEVGLVHLSWSSSEKSSPTTPQDLTLQISLQSQFLFCRASRRSI